jgi:hypothetical protein
MTITYAEPASGSKVPHPHASRSGNFHRCPFCGSDETHPSARTGLYEQSVLRLKVMEPFLCYNCGRRFYDSVLG